METYIFATVFVVPIVMLWLNIISLKSRVDLLESVHREHGDRFTNLTNELCSVTQKAEHAVRVLNDNAKKFGLPYFKAR